MHLCDFLLLIQSLQLITAITPGSREVQSTEVHLNIIRGMKVNL